MLNDFILLQISIIVIIFLISNTNDTVNSVILGIIYLILNSLILWLEDSDILCNFLIIIDLGVFFIILSLSINFTKIFYNKNIDIGFFNYFYYILFFIFIYLILSFLSFNIDFNFNKNIEYSWFFYLTNYNFYNIKYSIFNSDLQILREVYFSFNNFEFFLISIFLYLSLIIVSSVFNIITMYINYIKSFEIIFNFNFLKQKSSYFLKNQNIYKQNNTKPNSKIWYKLSR